MSNFPKPKISDKESKFVPLTEREHAIANLAYKCGVVDSRDGYMTDTPVFAFDADNSELMISRSEHEDTKPEIMNLDWTTDPPEDEPKTKPILSQGEVKALLDADTNI